MKKHYIWLNEKQSEQLKKIADHKKRSPYAEAKECVVKHIQEEIKNMKSFNLGLNVSMVHFYVFQALILLTAATIL